MRNKNPNADEQSYKCGPLSPRESLGLRLSDFFRFSIFVLRISPCFLTAAVSAATSSHPGNIFTVGDSVTVPVPSNNQWQAFDYDDQSVAVTFTNAHAQFGKLPLGWYRLQSAANTNHWISFAIVPQSPTAPAVSPISIDVAMSWFYPSNRMSDVAKLCTLAGVNWVRDRLNWSEMEPQRGTFAGATRYDAAARAQSDAGLRVLQVNHISPKWAGSDPKRFPTDLRDAYNFHREMAKRWQGRVLAFEPWNEADIVQFGGHTGSEMASFQKAAYLGLKAGHSNVIASLNVWASHRRSQLDDFADNQAAAYFDTYNLHHYEPVERYPALYADHRLVSAGKPMWVTEFAMPVKWSGDEKVKELSDAELRRQSERLVKAFAASLHEGPEQSFYFMLPHYVEGQTQFGIIRSDLTPRPAYVALTAVARLLSHARPLGQSSGTNMHAYAFTGAANTEVIIAWSDAPTQWRLPSAATAVYDHLGRVRPPAQTVTLTPAPQFMVVPNGTASKLAFVPPPARPNAAVSGLASTIVLQPLLPADSMVLTKSAWRISSTNKQAIQVAAYNFGSEAVDMPMDVLAPAGWNVAHASRLKVPPGGRELFDLSVDCSRTNARALEVLKVHARAPGQGALVSIRLLPEPVRVGARKEWKAELPPTATAWVMTVSGEGAAKATANGDELIFEAEPKGSDKWFYPKVQLPNPPPGGANGVCFTFRLIEGEGTFRALFDERNGSGYVVDWLVQPPPGGTIEAVAQFEDATFGQGWSKPDPNHHFDPHEAAWLKIGCNTRSDRVRFAISNIRWISF